MIQFFLPTKVITQNNCLDTHSNEFSNFGKSAIIITGKSSAKNGSLNDLINSLNKEHIDYFLFDKVSSNPTIELAREVAEVAKNSNVDFVIGLGGGSPIDCAKAVALLVHNDLNDEDLFKGNYKFPILPIIAIPTTAGTGSEVTQYSILNNKALETKTSIAHFSLFPKVAFLDARYMLNLPKETTINTSLDALSHAIEGYLSIKATPYSNIFAEKSLQLLSECMPYLDEELSLEKRSLLLEASTMAGIVIAHSGTTAVHSLGYSLTYFKKIDHGRANALLLAEYLNFIYETHPAKVQKILDILNLNDLKSFSYLIKTLLGEIEQLTSAEVDIFVDKALLAPNLGNTLVKPSRNTLKYILQESLKIKK